MSAAQQSSFRLVSLAPQQPLGGAIIDADGREIPITEQMVQQACLELDRFWQQAPHSAAAAHSATARQA